MDALQPWVARGKVKLPEVEFQFVGGAIGISQDGHLRIGQFQSLQQEEEPVVALGSIYHLLDIQRKLATFGPDGRVVLKAMELLDKQMSVVDMHIGTQLFDGNVVGVDGAVGKRRLVEHMVGETTLSQKDGIQVELLDEWLAVGIVILPESIDEELVIGSTVGRNTIGSDVEVDELAGVEHQVIGEQGKQVEGHHGTTGMQECVVLLVVDGHVVQNHLVEPVHLGISVHGDARIDLFAQQVGQ